MHRTRLHHVLAGATIAGLTIGAATSVTAQQLDSLTGAGFRWRTVGPANFGGRVADVVGIPSPSKTFFVASAGGGIWKTTNAGITFRPIFDNEPVVAMGALAVAPSDTQQVWAGTGEQNSRNTIEPGAGIYKSNDGGTTWKLMGLEKTQHIGRIVVHPTNPNIVYVAALGAAWKANAERGLYKTEDGGQTWKLIKFVDDSTGFIDVAMDPSNPNVLYASSYQRLRGPYFLRSGGKGSALWKTTDGGATWTKIQGNGFPETMLGRIGIAISRSNPNIVYTLVEADSNPNPKPAKGTAKQKLKSGLYRSEDGGVHWTYQNDQDTRPFYYSQVRVDPKDPNRVYWSSTPVLFSTDGGKTARTATQGIHVDHHAMWIDPNDPEHFIVGDDGGVSQTWDRGGNYQFLNVLPIGQFYEVSYDFETPYNICGGAQDNGSWCGPSRRKSGPVTNSYWFTYAGGDGFYSAQDPDDASIIYGESQGGNVSRVNLKTGERVSLLKPSWQMRYRQFEDSILITRGDTTQPAPKPVAQHLAELRKAQLADSAAADLRFNWNTPFFLSPHNSNVFYMGGNKVLKSTKMGDDLYPISPDLSKRDQKKIDISIKTTGGITNDATGAETYGTVVALAESYVRPGWLYAGTDDGNVWTTRTDGASWEQIPATRFPGLPGDEVYVTRIEPSHFDTLTFYVAFDNHRVNDFTPYLYVTNDGGKSFRSLAGSLPNGVATNLHVVREDPYVRNLVYVGTSVGAYVSLDGGAHFQKFMTGMPTVPVFDLKIHPRDKELIAATHGRGFWIVDVAPLEQIASAKTTLADVHLFEPKTAYEYGQGLPMGASSNGEGQGVFSAPSPEYGAAISYRVAPGAAATTVAQGPTGAEPQQANAAQADAAQQGGGAMGGRRAPAQARIVITNVKGDTVRVLTGPAAAGLHTVTWDFRGTRKTEPLTPSAKRDSTLQAQRMNFVFDSLAQAGTLPKPAADRLKGMLQSGDFRQLFGGGRRGGATDRFQERPGEGAVQGAGGRGAGRGQGGGAPGEFNPMDMLQNFPGGFQALQELLRPPGQRGVFGGGFGGFGGRGAQAPVVNSGDYLVTLIVNGQKTQQVLRVERVSGGEDSGFGFENEEHDGQDP